MYIKKIIKILIMILIIVIFLNTTTSYAELMDSGVGGGGIDSNDFQDPTTNPDFWSPTIGDETQLTEKAGIILGIINVIGVICSVVILAIIGIKYMIGSVEERADYKKAMQPYIIGVILLAGATTIPNAIYSFVSEFGLIT